ncbi:hypothetical protein Q4551_12240 [Oceanobacter sp. 5_MG-2023]|uniref:hypothetical protein n=1 Tax=Oceanobacter sp. 5_MG-2023 TaxID=3062645 RepID=UPI0026E3CBBE|nr:hypothetical protein [Oceanobacter sp. 5_MG-2023]MDO6683059.1 hypothetical protein [Oceanobacter sp. 5_MG-2023]
MLLITGIRHCSHVYHDGDGYHDMKTNRVGIRFDSKGVLTGHLWVLIRAGDAVRQGVWQGGVWQGVLADRLRVLVVA